MTELTRRMVDYEDDDAAEFIIMFYERQAMAHLDAVADAINEDNIDEVLAGFYEKEKDTYNDMLKISGVKMNDSLRLHSAMYRRHSVAVDEGDVFGQTKIVVAAEKVKTGKQSGLQLDVLLDDATWVLTVG
ncbi:hypothetical protein quinque_008829 [Culex quinquefasciatus]